MRLYTRSFVHTTCKLALVLHYHGGKAQQSIRLVNTVIFIFATIPVHHQVACIRVWGRPSRVCTLHVSFVLKASFNMFTYVGKNVVYSFQSVTLILSSGLRVLLPHISHELVSIVDSTRRLASGASQRELRAQHLFQLLWRVTQQTLPA